MNTLRLDGLDGRLPLAFLAGLGVTRLLVVHAGERVELSWAPDTCTALLHSTLDGVDEVVDRLVRVVDGIPEDGVLPGVAADFPPRGEAPDRLRLPRRTLRELADAQVEPGSEAEAWMSSLVTDLSVDDRGRADISLYTAPSGKQSMRTMLEKPLALVRGNSKLLSEALTGWRRYPDVTGEYLDHQVLFDAADAADGKSRERGVPGATWLALMSYPLLRTTADGGEPLSVGWHRRHRRQPRLVYPLWQQPLDLHAIQTLLTHPLMSTMSYPDSVTIRMDGDSVPQSLRQLGVFLVRRAARRRIPGRTFAGVLAPLA